MPILNIAVANTAFGEFMSTLVLVFGGELSCKAYSILTHDGGANTPLELIVATISLAFGIFIATSVCTNISGTHVNPAVTFGELISGHVTLSRSILYWIAQSLGSVVACLLFMLPPTPSDIAPFSLLERVGVWNALVLEIGMAFGFYIVYATAVDPKNGDTRSLGSSMIGLIVGANIFVGCAFDVAPMNPAVPFGPAVVSWTWDKHWVYWLGPFAGAAIAAKVYDVLFPTSNTHEQPSDIDY